MNQYQYQKSLERELRKINRQIDSKLIRGLSYSIESMRHRQLTKRLYELRRQSSPILRLLNTFIF